MAVFYQTTGAGGTAGGSAGTSANPTWSHTSPGGSDVMVVCVLQVVAQTSSGTTTLQTSTVTYGGQSMTSVGRQWFDNNAVINSATGNGYLEYFVLANPPSGAQTVSATVTLNASAAIITVAANSISYSNVGGYLPPQTSIVVPIGGAGTTWSSSKSSDSGRRLVYAIIANGVAIAAEPTKRFEQTLPATAIKTIVVDAEGTSSMSFSGTRTSTAAVVDYALELVPARPIPGKVYFDAAGAGNASHVAAGGTLSETHIVNGNALLVFVNQEVFGAGRGTVTVSAGGTPMTELGTIGYLPNTSGYYCYLTVFGLLSPPKGSISIAATMSKASYASLDSVSYHNVSSFDTAVTGNGTGTSASLAAPSTANQLVVNAFGGYTTNFTKHNKSERKSRPYGANVNLSATIAESIGDSSLSFTATTATGWGGLAVPMNPSISNSSAVSKIAFDSVGAGSAVQSYATSWSHTINGNALVVGIVWQVNAGAYEPTSVTVGGQALTKLHSTNPYYYWDGTWAVDVTLYGILNPPTGTQTIQVTFPALTVYLAANSVSYKNVRGFGKSAEATGSSASPSLAIQAAPGQRVVQVVGGMGNTWDTYSHNSRWNQPYNAYVNSAAMIGDADGDSLVNFNAGPSASTNWGTIAISLIPYRSGN